jgi:hypothetical protein
MTILSVGLGTESDAAQRAVLASVPRLFRISDGDEAPDVVVVSGRGSHWPDEVARAVGDGAKAVVVSRPAVVEPGRVRELARAVAGRSVVAVDTPYATNRTWESAKEEVAADAQTASIVDSLVTAEAGGLATALLDQLALVRPLFSPTGLVRVLHHGERAYALTFPTSGPRVTLSGAVSPGGHTGLTLDVVGPARRWQVRFADTAVASPVEVTRHEATGALSLPLLFESGRRVTWQRLHEALTRDGLIGYSLDQLAEAMDTANRAFSHEQIHHAAAGNRPTPH